jgi:MtN3 and saliva related transmembrane protein
MDLYESIGLIGTILVTIAFFPQIYKTWKTKNVTGLSLGMYLSFFTGTFLWLIYGIYIDSFAMILASGIAVVSIFLLILMKLKYK